MSFPKWLKMLWILERYRDRVFLCNTDPRNSSLQAPRRGDFDLGKLHRSSKNLCCSYCEELFCKFLVCGARALPTLSTILYVADPPDLVLTSAVGSTVNAHGYRRVRLYFGTALAASGHRREAHVELALAAKGPDQKLAKDALARGFDIQQNPVRPSGCASAVDRHCTH